MRTIQISDTDAIRFNANLRIAEGECWAWAGTFNAQGVPTFNCHGTTYTAAQVAYTLAHDEPPARGLVIVAACGTPHCLRPDHLTALTRSAHMRAARAKVAVSRGAAHHNAVLTERMVRQIRSLREYGMTLPAMASAFGVSLATISDVVYRRRWQHVE